MPDLDRPVSSRWFTYAEPAVYAARAVAEVERLLGQERLAPSLGAGGRAG